MYTTKSKHIGKQTVIAAINTLLHSNHRYVINKAKAKWCKTGVWYALRGMQFTNAEVLQIKAYCFAKSVTVNTAVNKAQLNNTSVTTYYTLLVK